MKADVPTDSGRHGVLTKVLFKLPRSVRGHVVAIIGEFFGTMSFIFFAFAGTQTANVS